MFAAISSSNLLRCSLMAIPTGWKMRSREKQITAGSDQRKTALIEAVNPDWRDLYEELAQ
ncbi:MAG: hypothetical protein NVSMB26_18470 [Beijerinckiaceae bacterium]